MTAGQFRQWRAKRRLTMLDAAKELGCGEQSMADYTHGRRRIPLSVARLCWALRCIDILQWRLQCSEAIVRRLQAEIHRMIRLQDLTALERLGAELDRYRERRDGNGTEQRP